MTQFVMNNEVPIRLAFFFGVLAVMAIWELPAPRRALSESKTLRWTGNLGIVFLNSLVLRLAFSVAAATLAGWLGNGRDVQVLDVRSAREYHGPDGRIEPSVLIPIDELERRLGELEPHRGHPIVVV